MNPASLVVEVGSTRVGALACDDAGRMTFQYDVTWLELAGAYPISRSLPLRDEPYREPAHFFFANLLPEGAVRTAVTRRFGISEDNDFALLRAIGGDCAGALSVRDPDARTVGDTAKPRTLTDSKLCKLNGQTPAALSFLVGSEQARLSLAGAQDKLPVVVDGKQLVIPGPTTPSTHILKFQNRHYAHLPANEVFTTRLAEAMGLDVCPIELRTLSDGSTFSLVERYDRRRGSDEQLTRIHQEDLCQALGFPSNRKYEDEGGPAFEACVDVALRLHQPVVELRRLVTWQIANLLLGNSDGHAKNLSILYGPEGTRLSPAYDLVCTRAYASLSRHLALGVGGERDPGQVKRAHWMSLADSVGIRPAWVLERVDQLLSAAANALKSVGAEFRDEYGNQPAVDMVTKVVRKQIRRTRAMLETG